MKSLSSFRLPDDEKILYRESLENARVDYERFSFQDKEEAISFFGEIGEMRLDTDNGSIGYVGDGLIHRIPSPRGIGFQYVINMEGAGPIPIFYLELYTKDNRLGESYGRIDFYGAYYHFLPILEENEHWCTKIYKNVKKMNIKRTRVDIALDFATSFPENAEEYFFPPTSQKRGVRSFHDDSGRLNSVSYLPQRNKGYGVRIYNKKFDTLKKKKENWYSDEWLAGEHTRIEYEFYPPYSDSFSDQELIDKINEKLLEGKKVTLGFKFEPLRFRIENAYKHFERYAKNHGLPLEKLMMELLLFHAEKLGVTSQELEGLPVGGHVVLPVSSETREKPPET